MKKIITHYFLLIINTYSTDDINVRHEENEFILELELEKSQYYLLSYNNNYNYDCNYDYFTNTQIKKQYTKNYLNENKYTKTKILQKEREKFVILYNALYDENVNLANLDEEQFNHMTKKLQNSYLNIIENITQNCSAQNLTEKEINFISLSKNFYTFLENIMYKATKLEKNENPLFKIVEICENNWISTFPNLNKIYKIMKFYQKTEELSKNMKVEDVTRIFEKIVAKKKLKKTLDKDEKKILREYKQFEKINNKFIHNYYKANKHIFQKKFEEIIKIIETK
jgi:hypothetical protein